jgi:non-specific serine/threonine protein kinase
VPALDSSDVAAVIERMAPRGREFVRLPWTTPHPIAEAAARDRPIAAPRLQVRLRYRNARTFLGALTGWLEATADDEGGPAGASPRSPAHGRSLPALPGARRRECSASPRSRASAPTRSRVNSCPTWRCPSSC